MPNVIHPVVEPGSIGPTQQPILVVDEELALRPWRSADSRAVMRAFSTPDIQRWHFRRQDSLAEAEAWIEQCHADWKSERAASWAITFRSSDRVVGRVTVYLVLTDGRGEISYWVLPESRQMRVATRAVRTATVWAHELGLHRVELQHSVDNEASGMVAVEAGYHNEGIRRGAILHHDGWHDMRLYSHLATD